MYFLSISGIKRKYNDTNELKKSKTIKKSTKSVSWVKCKHCRESFLTEAGLRIHIVKSHPFRNALNQQEEQEEQDDNTNENPKDKFKGSAPNNPKDKNVEESTEGKIFDSN